MNQLADIIKQAKFQAMGHVGIVTYFEWLKNALFWLWGMCNILHSSALNFYTENIPAILNHFLGTALLEALLNFPVKQGKALNLCKWYNINRWTYGPLLTCHPPPCGGEDLAPAENGCFRQSIFLETTFSEDIGYLTGCHIKQVECLRGYREANIHLQSFENVLFLGHSSESPSQCPCSLGDSGNCSSLTEKKAQPFKILTYIMHSSILRTSYSFWPLWHW